MNIDNIDKLIDFLKTFDKDHFQFNMAEWIAPLRPKDEHGYPMYHEPHCGTVGCIAGFTAIVAENLEDKPLEAVDRWWLGATSLYSSPSSVAEKFLDLDPDQAFRLFSPPGLGFPYSCVTPAMAITVLENLKTTGTVDWGIVRLEGLQRARERQERGL